MAHGSPLLTNMDLPQFCCTLSGKHAFHSTGGSWIRPPYQDGLRQPRSTKGNSFLNCAIRCPLFVPIPCGGNFWCSSTMVNTRQFFAKLYTKLSTFRANLAWSQSGAPQPWSTQGNSLLNCVLRCPLLVPISRGRNFWCSSTMVNTRQFFTKLCTKISTFGANLVCKQFLVFVNRGQHKAILY